jgi:hypothetical protein
MASITTWVRIEPRARDADLLAGAEARLHDPLWLLARQWQLRELAGFDGGSTISALAHVVSSRLDALRAPGGDWRAFAADRTPIEVALAAAPDDVQPALASRVRGGRQLLRMLARESVDTAPFLAKFALAAADDQLLDDDDRLLLVVMRGRVPDGDLAAATLAPLVATSDLPAAFGVPAAQIPGATRVVRAWLQWRADLASTAPGPTWRSDANAYRFDARASGDLGTIDVAFQHAEERPVRWYDASATTATGPTAGAGQGTDVVAMPSRVRYRGMPARRYWDLEDGAVHWPSIDAGPGDIGRVMLVEIALTLADHWLMIPLELPAGSLARVDSLVGTDTFGVASVVRSAADIDGDASPWRFCELTRAPGIAGPLLLVTPAASEPIVGRPLEAVDLARDELSNVLWAIERTRVGADGRPRTIPPPIATAVPASADAPPLVYRVGPDVPDGYHPYVPHTGATGLELARASVPGAVEGRVALPARFTPAAVPARPRQLRRVDELLRTPDGAYHWVRRRVLVATTPRPNVTLQFDQLVDRRTPP